MKKLAIFSTVAFTLLFSIPLTFAQGSGACSSHNGVNCAAGPDTDGSVICMDGWMESSVFYYDMKDICEAEFVNTAFYDVGPAVPFTTAIEYVKSEGVVEGYSDGFYRPLNNINRAEFVKILIEYKYPIEIASAVGSACFDDIEGSEWFAKYVCFAKKEGIIEGYPDGQFKPANFVNVAESLKIVLETIYGSIPDASGEWYQKYVTYAENNNLMLGWESVADMLSRGEMAELIYRTI